MQRRRAGGGEAGRVKPANEITEPDASAQQYRAAMKHLAMLLSMLPLVGCSQSPGEAFNSTVTAAVRPLMQNLVEKDASRQANALISLIANKPECEVYKQALREAGKGAPADGSTQWKMAHARQDACNAGCCTG